MSEKLSLYAAYFLLLLMVFAAVDTQGTSGSLGSFGLLIVKMLYFLVDLVLLIITLAISFILISFSFGPVGVMLLAIIFVALVGWRESFNFVVFSLILIVLLLMLF